MDGDVKEGVAIGEFAQVGTSCVIDLYYVLSDDRVERRCDDVQERQRVLPACVFEILSSTEREMLFSGDVIASHKPARFEFASTGRDRVRVVPK